MFAPVYLDHNATTPLHEAVREAMLPWLVTVVGVSGAVALARLAPAAPYLWALVAVLMAATAWWTFRPRRSCADGSCERPPSWRLRWLTLLVAAGAITLFVVSQPWTLWR